MTRSSKKRGIILAVSLGLMVGLLALNAGPAVAKGKKPAKEPSLVDVAVAVNTSGPYAGAFDTLIAAVGAADPVILETLSSKGQYTVFAPTDDAFAKLGLNPSNVGTLPRDALTTILAYHVAVGNRDSSEVLSSSEIRMLAGGWVMQDSGVLTDNLGRTANIIVTDVPATNGVIHAIDSVLLPFDPTA